MWLFITTATTILLRNAYHFVCNREGLRRIFGRMSSSLEDRSADEKDQPLYDSKILLDLDFYRSPTKFNPRISAAAPGEPWMEVRALKSGDFDRGFLELLSQLTAVGSVTREKFLNRFYQMKASGDYFVTVIVDKRSNKIIGSATLVLERKFIHGCAIRGRLEDVVVNDTYRGKQLGKLIVVTVSLLAEKLGCYKMSLDCKDKLIQFYTSIGYVLEPGNSNTMNIRYNTPELNNKLTPKSKI